MDRRNLVHLSPLRCYKASFARSRVVSLLDYFYGSSGQLKSHSPPQTLRITAIIPNFWGIALGHIISACNEGSGYSLCLGKQRQISALLPFYKSCCKPSLARNMNTQGHNVKNVWWTVGEPDVRSTSSDVTGSVFNLMNKNSALPLSNYVENSPGEWNLNLSCCIAWGCVKDFK